MEEQAQLEEAIRQSPLFSISQQEDESGFQRERLRLTELCYRYLMCLQPKTWEPYGWEILQTVQRCIRNFDPEKGLFLHYFLAAWKREFQHIRGREAQEPLWEAEEAALPASDSDPARLVEQKEGLEQLLDGIDSCYRTLHPRQQPLLADCITALLLPHLPEDCLPDQTFLSPELLALWRNGGTLPTQRDLARKYGRDESSVSRSMRNFRKKLKPYL